MLRKYVVGMKLRKMTCIIPYAEKRGNNWFGIWECDCGIIKLLRNSTLDTGNVVSCGCILHKREGESHSSTYNSWKAMRARCTKEKHPAYHNYGGRGISICKEWDSYEVFKHDMGLRPEGTELDRIDVNGNYNKDNCRWISRKENSQNRRDSCTLTFEGHTAHVSYWAEKFGLKEDTLYNRIARRKWTIEKALKTPVGK